MKLTAGQIAGFLDCPKADVRVFLLYGPDAGLVCERAKALTSKLVKNILDPFTVTTLTGAELGSASAKLYDESSAIPFGGGRKLVRISQATEANQGPLADFLKAPPAGDAAVIIEAGDLESRSKLRTLCEKSPDLAVAIPCYFEDIGARQATITSLLKEGGLAAPREVVRFLTDVLPPNRLALRSEMEKLSFYVKGRVSVTKEDVSAVISDASGSELDDFVNAVCGGDSVRTMNLLQHFFAEQVSCVMLLRAVQRQLLRLQLARALTDQGLSLAEAFKKLSPPVFWKAEEPMKRQMQRFTPARIEKRLTELMEAEAAIKRTGAPNEAITAQILLNISAKA